MARWKQFGAMLGLLGIVVGSVLLLGRLWLMLIVIYLVGMYIVWFVRKAHRTREARMRKLKEEE